MIRSGKTRQSFSITSLSVQEINRVLMLVQQRLDQLDGVGQHPDLHGAKTIRQTLGTEEKEGITTDFTVPVMTKTKVGGGKAGGSITVQADDTFDVQVSAGGGLKIVTGSNPGLAIFVRPNYGINLYAEGIGLKKQAAITGPSTITTPVLPSGSDHINLASSNIVLQTLAVEIRTVKVAVDTLIARIKAAEVTL